MKNCFFYSIYNLRGDTNIRCHLFEKDVDREICEKCPFYIQKIKAMNIIKRFVLERECKDKRGK